MSPELLAELQGAGALADATPPGECVPGAYAWHLAAAGVAAGCTALSFVCRVPELKLEAEGGWEWPESFLRHAGPELAGTPLSAPLAHVLRGALAALASGATEVELCSGSLSLTLGRRCRLQEVASRGPGFSVRVAWPNRPVPPETALLAQRARLSPVPVTVNDELVSLGLELGPCAVAREWTGGAGLPVEAQPLVFHSAPGTHRLWVGLGGAWFLDQEPGVRVWCVVDGLSYVLDHLDLGCPDLRAVVHAEGVRADASLQRLERDDRLAALLAAVRQEVEAAKRDLAASFPAPGPRGPGVWNLLRQVVCEERARGPARPALELCQRILADVPDDRARGFFREAAAGLAARLEEHELAQELIAQALADGDAGVGQALRLDTQGVVLLEAGQPQRAEEALLQAEEIKRRLLDAQEPHWVAETLDRLAAVALAQGRYASAERYAKRGVARALEGLGEGHPATAQALLGMARVYLAQDRLEEAESVVAQVRGEEAQALLHQSLIATLGERWDRARESAAQAGVRLARACGEGHPEALGALLLEGWACAGLEQWTEAGVRLVECVRGLECQLGSGHTDVAAARLALARVRWREGEWERSRRHLDAARESYGRRWGESHPAVARALDLSARVALAAGDPRRAERDSRAAVALLEPLLSAREGEGWWDSAGTVLYRWWRAHEEGGLRPVVGLPARRLGREAEELARAQAHLAKVLRAGRPEEAEEWATRARLIRQTRGRATLVREPGGVLRVSPDAIAVRLELEAPGRTLEWLRLDTARGRVALAARGQAIPERDLMLALIEPERKLLQADSALFKSPWGSGGVRFLLYAADQGSSKVSAIPYVVTAGFQAGPCLRVPVRLR